MKHRTIISLSDTEASFLAKLAADGKDIFTTQDAYNVLGEGKRTRGSLERLVHKGWLERIEKGKYLIVPLEAGPDRCWSEDAFVIARHLVEPSAIAYWSALNHWNLTEQVPRITYVQTTARKSNRKPNVLGMQFQVVRIKPERFFGTRRFYVGQSAVETTDREKTLMDCLDRPDLSGGVAEVAKALQEGDGEFDWGRTTEYLRRFGSGAVVKRLGFLAEASRLTDPPRLEVLQEWQGLLTAGISKLDPSSPREPHRIATRWRVAVNLPEDGMVIAT
jgi:predicted transcriptional regulator of viral defense system